LRGGLVSSAVFAAAFFLLQSECSASAKDKTPPKSVSIVIPVFNEASCIEALLEFLQLLDPSPLEIIVVDGGSTDETVRLISKLIKKKKMKNVALWKTRLGSRSKQMNFGARKSKGDYIMFLHADTVPPLDTVSILRNAFARSPKAHLAGFTAIMDHRASTFWGMSLIHAIKTHLGPLIYRPSYFARGVKVFFGDQAMVAERKAFDAVGGFNESLNIMEDLDLCVKVFLGIRPDPRDENKCTSISSKEGRSWGSGSGSRFVSIDRCVHTSGRRVAEWGSWNSLKLFLVLSTSYCYGASPSSLNELGNKVYTAIR
jgi:cellulose synthase/poly-beta-1,6-N-acetylglucosamine synthase-like glycosyltransferase